jgi:hypothetical protein
MKKLSSLFLLLWSVVWVVAQAPTPTPIPLSQSLNNIPTASTISGTESFIAVQGGVGKKFSTLLVSSVFQPTDLDLTSLASANTMGIFYRSAANTWSPVTIGTGLSFTGGVLSSTAVGTGVVDWGDITGTLSSQLDLQAALDAKEPLDGDLTSIAGITATGSWYYRSASNVWTPVVVGSGLNFSGGTLTAVDTGGGTWGSITGTLSAQADLQSALNGKQPLDGDLTSLSAASATGLYYRSGTDAWSLATIGTGLSFTGGTLSVTTIPATAVTFSDPNNNFTATNVDAALAELFNVNALGPNTAASKVDWSQIKNMPSGFADGVDDTSGGGGGGTVSVIKSNGTTVGTTITTLDFLGADFNLVESPTGEVNINIANSAITFAKMQNVATGVLLGRSTASTGVIETISVGTGLSLAGGTLSATGSGSSVAWGSITGTLSAQTDLQTALDAKQPLDGDLTAIAALSTTGNIFYRSAANIWSPVVVGGGLVFTGGNLSVGDLSGTYQPLDSDLISLAAASNTNTIYYRSATNTWSPVTIGAGLSFAGGTLNSTSSGVAWGAITGTLSSQADLQSALDGKQPVDADLTSLAAISATGNFYYRSATNTWSPVTVGSGLTFVSGTLASAGGATWGAISGTLSSQNDLQTALDGKQPLDGDLTALAGISTTGSFYYRSAANTWTPVTIGSGISFTSGTLSSPTTWGSITGTLSSQTDLQAALDTKQPLDGDLTSLAAASATGSLFYRSAANTWAPVTVGSGLSFSSGALTGAPTWGSITGTLSGQTDLQTALDAKQPLDADLTSLAATSATNSLYYRSAANTWSPVTVGTGLAFTGGTLSASGIGDVTAAAAFGNDNRLIRSDGISKGVQATGITVDDSNNVTGIGNVDATTTSTDTFTILDAVNQSHGLSFIVASDLVANKTFTYTGAFNFGMTLTGDTSVTFPTSGTLATLADISGAGGADGLSGTHASPITTNPFSPTWTAGEYDLFYGVSGTINLPVAASYTGKRLLVYNTGAFTITIDPSGSEVLVRDGTVQLAGQPMTLSSGAGNYVELLCDGARWITLAFKGTLASVSSEFLTGLVSYWKLDETSGTRADSHGTNNLTDNNTVLSAAGIISNAADFEQSNSEYLSAASNSTLQTGNINFTFAGWFKLESTTNPQVIIGKDVDSPGGSRDYVIYFLPSTGLTFFINGGGLSTTEVSTTGLTFTVGTWYFFVAWHDAAADTLNIQVNDGTVFSSSTGGTVPNASGAEFRIGAMAYNSVEMYFDGLIDEVGFWKVVLTPTQRTYLYNSGAGRTYPAF